MIKKTLLILVIIFTASCGYEPILSKKNESNYNFSLSKITFEKSGDKVINLKIKEKLNNYRLNKAEKDYILKIKSTSGKVVIAKNLKGDPTNFKNTATLYVDVLVKNNIKNRLKFEASFNYNNDKNKFDLKNYEKDIKKNLAETMASKLIVTLSNIQ